MINETLFICLYTILNCRVSVLGVCFACKWTLWEAL